MNKRRKFRRRLIAGTIASLMLALLAGWDVGAQPAVEALIDFQREIRPILSDKCFLCHGPDSVAGKIKLRLDSEAAAKADLGRGRFAIVPGHPEKSELVRRISHPEEAMRMPPVDSGRSLDSREIRLLTEWIRQGARWQSHWSFAAPVKAPAPVTRNQTWARNSVDRFVISRLEREGLQPSPEADRSTLIRRVFFDLTGLPPTPAEVDDFLTDPARDAYEKVVDRLLASPRYGERMAYKWLDAARYADTNGYQIDGNRDAWRWRDWVIEAFNSNKPFDQFTIEQLAGDLLPNPTLDQRIATAFNRNHRINAEGGIVPEEYRNEYVVDRVDTTSTVFMGLTLGCARCHNHKYDPFTQQDYYRLSGYFNSINEDGRAFDYGNSPPVMLAPTSVQQERLRKFDEDISVAEQQLEGARRKTVADAESWVQGIASGSNQQWFPEDGLIVHVPMREGENPVFNKSERTHHDQYNKGSDNKPQTFETGFRNGTPRYITAPTGQGVAFDGKLYFDGGIHADYRYRSTSGDYMERFTISAWIYPESEQSGSIVTKVSDSPQELEGNVPRAEGYGLYFIDGKIHFNMVFRWGDDALRVESAAPLALKQWHHVAVVFDGVSQWDDRIHLYIDGRESPLRINQRSFFLLFGGTKNTLKIAGGAGEGFRFKGSLAEVRMYSRALGRDDLALLACADPVEKIASLRKVDRSAVQQAKLDRAFISAAGSAELKAAYQRLVAIRSERLAFIDSLPTLMVMDEMKEPRPTFLLRRGAYDSPGEEVGRGLPASLPGMQAGLPNNRLGLAKWLVSREHPLTARVIVNRMWQMLFGVGLVRTSEDFGSQGEAPSHPELLDWLAVELRDGGWDMKALLKMLVTSATYRQSSRLTPELLQRDPDNRLLARGSRFRLSAEMIRDQALYVAGLLVEKLGGPSVRPYQPDGLFKDLTFGGMTGYEQARGEGLWRRSVYTFWKRTILAPNMQTFDASAREYCNVRETRTNTPLQSLNLMNDVTYVEAARLLAERILREGGASPQSRLKWAFRTATSRNPTADELNLLLRDLEKQRSAFRAAPENAAKLLEFGEKRNDAKMDRIELAAYSAIASLILNLDEVITRQ